MTRNRWLTPASLPDNKRCRAFAIPNSQDWEAILYGALLPLTDQENFEEFGAVSAEDAAAAFDEMLIGALSGQQCCGSQYYNAVIETSPDSLIRYWPLWDSTGSVATDLSENEQHGDATGVQWGEAGIGDGNTSAGFDGTTAYIDVYSSDLNTKFNRDTGTIAAWVRIPSGDWETADTKVVIIVGYDAGTNYVALYKTAFGSIAWHYEANDVTSRVLSDYQIANTNWVHVAMTFDTGSDEVAGFLNGVRYGVSGNLGAWSGNLNSQFCVIGAGRTTPMQVWPGQIAHLAMWDSVLTDQQIGALSRVIQ